MHDFQLPEVRNAVVRLRAEARVLSSSVLPEAPTDGAIEGFGGAATGEASTEVVVLGHGHLGVTKLVGDLAGGEFAFVEQRGAGLAEHVTGHPGELAASAGLPKLS